MDSGVGRDVSGGDGVGVSDEGHAEGLLDQLDARGEGEDAVDGGVDGGGFGDGVRPHRGLLSHGLVCGDGRMASGVGLMKATWRIAERSRLAGVEVALLGVGEDFLVARDES